MQRSGTFKPAYLYRLQVIIPFSLFRGK